MLKVVGASWSQIRLSSWIIGIVIILGIIAIIISEIGKPLDDGNYSATVYWDQELGYTIHYWGQGTQLENLPFGVARAHYDPHIEETGWAVFQVESQDGYKDETQAYAAGMLEGALTWQMIYWHWQNTVESFCEDRGTFCDQVKHYLTTNMQWASATAKDRDSEPYWHQVNLFYEQLFGLRDGFNLALDRSRRNDIDEITDVDLLWMNMFSDINDLENRFSNVDKESDEWEDLTRRKNRTQSRESFDCGYQALPLSSAFIKIVPETESLYVAHNSAGMYSHMLKMFKRYNLHYHRTGGANSELVPGTTLSFSSYPAGIHSMDDFYIISGPSEHYISVTATPIPIYNDSLWDSVSTKDQVQTGPRAIAASRLATSPQNWADYFSKFNSGTGNKQWMVVDINLFNEAVGERERPDRYSLDRLENLFWVVEQIPGTIVTGDQTELLLSQTYWASYGIPFYKDIYVKSGTKKMAQEHGPTFTYNETAIAKIFQRDQDKIKNMQTVTKLMRSNSYKTDQLSQGNPRCAIGSRGDVSGLSMEDEEPEGVIDVKVLRNNPPPHLPLMPVRNSTMRLHVTTPRLKIYAGPIYTDNDTPEADDDVEPFSWTDGRFPNASHVGQPDIWTFPPLPIHFV